MNKNSNTLHSFYWGIIGFILGMIVVAFAIQTGQHKQASQTQDLLFSFQGKDYSVADLPTRLANDYFDLLNQDYQQKLDLLKRATLELQASADAKAKHISEDQAWDELINIQQPTEAEIGAFYNENESRINQPFPDVKEQIRDFLVKQRRLEKQQEVIAKMQAAHQVEFHLQRPLSPLEHINTAGFPSKGDPKAPVQIVEFADYQCPHCKHAESTLHQLLEDHPDQIHFTYMDFPINASGISRKVAEGAVCADQQGQFWPYHDRAFSEQDKLTQDSAIALAQQLNLDMTSFRSCLNDSATAARVKQSEQQALDLGLHGTPGIYIDGRRFQGPDLDQSLQQAVMTAIAGTTSKH